MIKPSLLVGSAAFVVGLALGAWVTNNSWQSDWDQAQLAIAEAQATAVNKAVEEYKTKLISMEKVEHETKAALATALLDADSAARKSDSLQQQIDDYLRNGSKGAVCTSSTSERAAKATTELVLAELFRRADKRAGELAAALDQARIAGLACEDAYNSLK